jgi:hypothetical protein
MDKLIEENNKKSDEVIDITDVNVIPLGNYPKYFNYRGGLFRIQNFDSPIEVMNTKGVWEILELETRK